MLIILLLALFILAAMFAITFIKLLKSYQEEDRLVAREAELKKQWDEAFIRHYFKE